jgi:hypothetical protein
MAQLVLYLIAVTPLFWHITDIVRMADTHTHQTYVSMYTHTDMHTYIPTYVRGLSQK